MEVATATTRGHTKTIAELETELADAVKQHAECCQELDTARRNETAALNRVNDKQKQLDAAIEMLKSRAPRNSNWSQERMPRHRVES